MLGFGRALSVGVVGPAAALIALSLADAPLGAEPASRSEGRIAFTFGESGVDHPSQLAVMDADGKNRRVLPPYGVNGLSWSPDGRSIAFAEALGVYTINVDGRPGDRRVVRIGGSPDWSPNGRSIAFERGRDIWIFNPNDRRQRRILHDGRSPRWSPDSRKLAFTRGAFYADSSPRVPDLWMLDVAGKKERRLVRNGDDADWSPDGRRIAFERCRANPNLECFVYVMRSDGTKRRRLFRGESPVWSPNGKELAFVGRDDRRRYEDAVIRSRLDGRGRRVLFGQKPYCGCAAPDWSPHARRSRR